MVFLQLEPFWMNLVTRPGKIAQFWNFFHLENKDVIPVQMSREIQS